MILADKYEKYKLTYSGCHVFNPGGFVGNSFSFSTYCPAERSSEEGCVIYLGLSKIAPDVTCFSVLVIEQED